MAEEVQIVMHAGAFGASDFDDALDTALRDIAVKASSDPEGEWAEKYGTDFDNDEFMMHHYCWCESAQCQWCAGCYCADNEWRDPAEAAPEGVKCDWCANVHRWADKGALAPDDPPHYGAPHFWHKPSGFRVWWYKYIGRDVKTHGTPPADLLERCLASIRASQEKEDE